MGEVPVEHNAMREGLAPVELSTITPGDLSSPDSAPSGPVDEPHRISALDTIRGFALLGILLMNIIGMGMYGAAYDDPTVTGGSTGLNLWVWIVMHVLAEGKMRCLFSMIFG